MKSQARIIVDALLEDMANRAGLSDTWDGIDADTKRHIIDQWTDIVEAQLSGPQSE